MDKGPSWSLYKIRIEAPETRAMPIAPLHTLRMTQKYKYGTKAANLGELHHVLTAGSDRLLGFYRVRRPPRENLIAFIARFLNQPETANLDEAASRFLRGLVQVPRGIALPFSCLRDFLESSGQIQQTIGKLKMALELNARQVDSLSVSLRQRILEHRMPEALREEIERAIQEHLPNVTTFVIRSSSNAEDLDGFCAAGLYETVNRVSTWSSFLTASSGSGRRSSLPRSVRLRHEVGISLEDSYMGVVLQEEIAATMGGVLVTANPMNRASYRDVYFNIAPGSIAPIVEGRDFPTSASTTRWRAAGEHYRGVESRAICHMNKRCFWKSSPSPEDCCSLTSPPITPSALRSISSGWRIKTVCICSRCGRTRVKIRSAYCHCEQSEATFAVLQKYRR